MPRPAAFRCQPAAQVEEAVGVLAQRPGAAALVFGIINKLTVRVQGDDPTRHHRQLSWAEHPGMLHQRGFDVVDNVVRYGRGQTAQDSGDQRRLLRRHRAGALRRRDHRACRRQRLTVQAVARPALTCRPHPRRRFARRQSQHVSQQGGGAALAELARAAALGELGDHHLINGRQPASLRFQRTDEVEKIVPAEPVERAVDQQRVGARGDLLHRRHATVTLEHAFDLTPRGATPLPRKALSTRHNMLRVSGRRVRAPAPARRCLHAGTPSRRAGMGGALAASARPDSLQQGTCGHSADNSPSLGSAVRVVGERRQTGEIPAPSHHRVVRIRS